MRRARPRRRLALAAAVIAVFALGGCGEDDAARTDAPPSGLLSAPATPAAEANAVVDPAAPPPTINALDIDPESGEFLLTTNRGFFRIGRDDGEVTQVRATVRSGANSAAVGTSLVSRNRGRTFSEQLTPSGVPIADLEVDPANPRRIVAASDAEMYRSAIGGAAWKLLGGASGARLAWPARDALYRALKDGAAQVSADGGSSWKTAGRIDGEPYRVKAVSRDELYLVIGDGTILHTRDGAKTWEPAFTP